MENSNSINTTLPKTEEDTIFISVEKAVKKTGIGRNKMLQFAKMKGFPAIITPHKILIDSEMLPIWLKQHYGRYKN